MESFPKILIVEDDELNLRAYTYCLRKYFQITTCKTDKEFFEKLALGKQDIFLVDLSLPGGKDGIQLVQALRAMDEYQTTPIIILSAHAFRVDEERALNAGATKFLRKPIENSVLLSEISKFI
jgi:CheY-like chemotaxis protein